MDYKILLQPTLDFLKNFKEEKEKEGLIPTVDLAIEESEEFLKK